MLCVWWVADEASRWGAPPRVVWVPAVGVLAVCGVLTRFQTLLWADTETLFRYTLTVTHENSVAHAALGLALARCGRLDDALAEYRKALEIRPDDMEIHNDVGNLLTSCGQFDEAIAHFRAVLKTKPDYAEVHYNLGSALLRKGQIDEAASHFRDALATKPDLAEAHCNLGIALAKRGQFDEAISHYQQALAIKPDSAALHDNLDIARDRREGILKDLAERRELLRTRPNDVALLNDTAWVLATNPNASIRNGTEAVGLAQHAVKLTDGKESSFLDTLAAAYAEAGRFSEAAKTAEQALALAASQNNTSLADALRSRIKLYQSGFAYRETQQPAVPKSHQP